MRTAVLAFLLSASSALAWDDPGWSPWSLSVTEECDGLRYTARATFTRAGKVWRVEASCEAFDTGTKAWLTQTGKGIARRSEQGLRADVERLDDFYVDEKRIVFGTMLCASGDYNVGTGD